IERVIRNRSTGSILRNKDGNWILGYNRYQAVVLLIRQNSRVFSMGSSLYLRKDTNGHNSNRQFIAWKSSLQIFNVPPPPNEVLGTIQQDTACDAFEQLI
ncbi:hypothetical protein Goshw_028016, partial [Gossypium schwendimanii]|nr:hypothetical protein [Gossypium schwendimanii]